MNSLNMIGRLDGPWDILVAKGSGNKFYKNVLRGKSGYDTASERVEKEWSIELIAFAHTGNSLNAHTGPGDLLGVMGKLQSSERDSEDGTRVYRNHSMAVDSYEVLEKARKEAADDSVIPF
jgi:single-stranded DNA-binding protein